MVIESPLGLFLGVMKNVDIEHCGRRVWRSPSESRLLKSRVVRVREDVVQGRKT
jgi:hypothetical protein